MNVLIFSMLFFTQIIFTIDNPVDKDLTLSPVYKSYDDALVRICSASRLIGPSFMTTLVLQKLSPEKAAEITAISKGEKTSDTISKRRAQIIHQMYADYRGTLDYFNKSVPLPTDKKDNNSN